jgi:hypothetical protein
MDQGYLFDANAYPRAAFTPEEIRLIEQDVARCFDDMAKRLTEGLYGDDAERRVHDLRKSVLGDEAGPGPNKLAGLAEWLP